MTNDGNRCFTDAHGAQELVQLRREQGYVTLGGRPIRKAVSVQVVRKNSVAKRR
eukprot:CAMPEP_0196662770 /NCGR_PEP_ID=MMETSP1086-20130531/50230_1 /TAXON_ID=77921 /ORGANISM="Cyanoptyche  gloeocystis , Strain SAG4.97" /LENGTH=53 /DNA_ID=CAMNT_0041998329 /DNA_START=10 /DNA_END=171 /DNA_ORIENTATION=+